jgi:signal transduction histidine kinase
VAFAEDVVHVRVRDNGHGPSGDGQGGQGLVGMHERVAMVGGSLRVGPIDGGGFGVEARLPIGEPAP